jgi:hypothetical protein
MRNIKILKRSIESIPKTHINKTVFEYYVDNRIVDSTSENTALIEVFNQVLTPDEENRDLKGNWTRSATVLVNGVQLPDTNINTYTGQRYVFKLGGTVIGQPATPAYLDPLVDFSNGTFREVFTVVNGVRYVTDYAQTNDLNLITNGFDPQGETNPYPEIEDFGNSTPATEATYFPDDDYYEIQGNEIATHGFDDITQTYKLLNFWNTTIPGALGEQIYSTTLNEKTTGFSVETGEFELKLTSIGEIDPTLKPSELTAKILLIAKKFKERPGSPSEIGV